eukprot:TRINITY_DN21271_c0_g2_i1.p1 TRINITY_DN21271_c0_g2~~TRINITY_DN21271_c0_g2_i1.p1  ORF type:complete len:631 (+),score=160.70 TRINITY_DN21271_c0_g2_i1:180-1895(+)
MPAAREAAREIEERTEQRLRRSAEDWESSLARLEARLEQRLEACFGHVDQEQQKFDRRLAELAGYCQDVSEALQGHVKLTTEALNRQGRMLRDLGAGGSPGGYGFTSQEELPQATRVEAGIRLDLDQVSEKVQRYYQDSVSLHARVQTQEELLRSLRAQLDARDAVAQEVLPQTQGEPLQDRLAVLIDRLQGIGPRVDAVEAVAAPCQHLASQVQDISEETKASLKKMQQEMKRLDERISSRAIELDLRLSALTKEVRVPASAAREESIPQQEPLRRGDTAPGRFIETACAPELSAPQTELDDEAEAEEDATRCDPFMSTLLSRRDLGEGKKEEHPAVHMSRLTLTRSLTAPVGGSCSRDVQELMIAKSCSIRSVPPRDEEVEGETEEEEEAYEQPMVARLSSAIPLEPAEAEEEEEIKEDPEEMRPFVTGREQHEVVDTQEDDDDDKEDEKPTQLPGTVEVEQTSGSLRRKAPELVVDTSAAGALRQGPPSPPATDLDGEPMSPTTMKAFKVVYGRYREAGLGTNEAAAATIREFKSRGGGKDANGSGSAAADDGTGEGALVSDVKDTGS